MIARRSMVELLTRRGMRNASWRRMNIEDTKESVKEGVNKQIEKIEGLAGEIRVKLHLATLDLKQEWDEKISPRLLELKTAPAEKIREIGEQLEGFVARFRKDDAHPKS